MWYRTGQEDQLRFTVFGDHDGRRHCSADGSAYNWFMYVFAFIWDRHVVKSVCTGCYPKVPRVMADDRARKYMDHIAYHGYDCQFNCSKERQMYNVIADLHRRWPDLEVWMTEICYAYKLK